ncbi:MAG: Gfo/Idh/MocA family oxidoreductase [Victivallaceae bacterium]|nr:Gfo/Idh/MocA family oxidoreductase [Victivallaceae bacterium]
MKKTVKIAIIGAGVRGTHLAHHLSSSGLDCRIAAVAEPDPIRRKKFAETHSLTGQEVFSSWEELFAQSRSCNAAVIATMDNQHFGPATAAAEQGWHILMEKPIADKWPHCLAIDKLCRENNCIVRVCHSLRFMTSFVKIKKIIENGTLGKIIDLEHVEAIGNRRFTHNYVRGRWGKEANNTFLLLHKCCHDLDFINWLIDNRCVKVSSFGSLSHFTPSNAPAGSGKRCLDDCKINNSCPYSAQRLYIDSKLDAWPARDVSPVHTRKSHLKAVQDGTWGKCVWRAGNDVVDHQVVMMEYENGTTATCTLSGFSATNGRRTRVHGTEGELLFDEEAGKIKIWNFNSSISEVIDIKPPDSYHPEDKDIVIDWFSAIAAPQKPPAGIGVDTREVLRSHAIVFAAELSRKEERTIEIAEIWPQEFQLSSPAAGKQSK